MQLLLLRKHTAAPTLTNLTSFCMAGSMAILHSSGYERWQPLHQVAKKSAQGRHNTRHVIADRCSAAVLLMLTAAKPCLIIPAGRQAV
jgi:hypothetical protein